MNIVFDEKEELFLNDLSVNARELMRFPWHDMSVRCQQWLSCVVMSKVRSGYGVVTVPEDRILLLISKLSALLTEKDRAFLDQFVWIEQRRIQDMMMSVNVMSSWLRSDTYEVACTIIRTHSLREVFVRRSGVEAFCAAASHQRDMLRKYGATKRCRTCNARYVRNCFVCSKRELEDEGSSSVKKKLDTKPVKSNAMHGLNEFSFFDQSILDRIQEGEG